MIDFRTGLLARILNETRPIDWLIVVIDVLVIAWIAVADLIKAPRRWKRRSAIRHLTGFLANGEYLLSARPATQASEADAAAWVEAVKSWINAVQSFLAKEAVRALVEFAHGAMGPRDESGVHPLAEDCFFELEERLRSLREIMERPEEYF